VAIGADFITLVEGAAAGSALTGWFAISQKAKARVQRRRSEVYVDMLAWIEVRVALMGGQLHLMGPAYPNDDPSHNKKTDPHPESTRDPTDTDPGTAFFVSLRARIIAFGSHDMSRAFDRWTSQYLAWKNADNAEEKDAVAHHLQLRPGPRIGPGIRQPRAWCRRKIDPGTPFPAGDVVPRTTASQGRLTAAIEYCASQELRKG
jgi:hypothetical protein